MLSEKNQILKFNQYIKSGKMSYTIYADLESLIKKISWMGKQSRKILSNKNWRAYSLWIFNVSNLGIWLHKRQTYFISWKRLYEKVLWIVKRTSKKYNWFWKEKMLPLTRKELKSHEDGRVCYISGKYFIRKFFKDINCRKVRDHCHYIGKYRGHRHTAFVTSNLTCEMKFL